MGGGADRTAVRPSVRGRVQGVGYRYWTTDQATALGLDGWVRNRADGSVEAVFAGDAAAVAEMVARCRKGPPFATVAELESAPEPNPVEPGFRMLPTV